MQVFLSHTHPGAYVCAHRLSLAFNAVAGRLPKPVVSQHCLPRDPMRRTY